MRVDYVLPALQPETLPELAGPGPEAAFRTQLKKIAVELPTAWQQQLGLNAIPQGNGYIGPPPRGPHLELGDYEAQRVQYRNLVARESTKLASPDATGHPLEMKAVDVMLKMLSDMQSMEDEITSRNVALTRG